MFSPAVDTLRQNQTFNLVMTLGGDFYPSSTQLSRQIGMLSGNLIVAGEHLDWLHANDRIASDLFPRSAETGCEFP